MKKTIYTVRHEARGDIDYPAHSYDKDEIVAAYRKELFYLTVSEKKTHVVEIEVREAEVLDGETAQEAFDRLFDEEEHFVDCNILDIKGECDE